MTPAHHLWRDRYDFGAPAVDGPALTIDTTAMAIPKDVLSMIARSAGKDAALIAEASDGAATAKAKLRAAEEAYEEKVTSLTNRFREGMTVGLQEAAVAGAVGFGIGGGIAYLAHDEVKAFLGKNSWAARLALPFAGVALGLATPNLMKDPAKRPGENATGRAGVYGASIGLVTVSSFLSYQDYTAKAKA